MQSLCLFGNGLGRSLFNNLCRSLFLSGSFFYNFDCSFFLSLGGLVFGFLGAAHNAHSDGCYKQYFFHNKPVFLIVVYIVFRIIPRKTLQNYCLFWIYAKKNVLLQHIFKFCYGTH